MGEMLGQRAVTGRDGDDEPLPGGELVGARAEEAKRAYAWGEGTLLGQSGGEGHLPHGGASFFGGCCCGGRKIGS